MIGSYSKHMGALNLMLFVDQNHGQIDIEQLSITRLFSHLASWSFGVVHGHKERKEKENHRAYSDCESRRRYVLWFIYSQSQVHPSHMSIIYFRLVAQRRPRSANCPRQHWHELPRQSQIIFFVLNIKPVAQKIGLLSKSISSWVCDLVLRQSASTAQTRVRRSLY